MPGPVPKRSDQRRRSNKPEVPIVDAPAAPFVRVPDADPDWHRLAAGWFDALKVSGQSVFYEPSDWATAVYVAEAMSRSLFAEKMSAVMFTAVMSASSSLLATEGDRRRMRIELERAKVEDPGAEHADATVTDIAAKLGA